MIKGSTDGDGKIDIEIPQECTTVRVKIGEHKTMEVEILESASQGKKAIKERLTNYGLYSGSKNSIIDEKTAAATLYFQDVMNEIDGDNLKLDGDPGPVTEKKMKEKSGYLIAYHHVLA